MDRLERLMKELTEAGGISGFEGEVRKKMEAYLSPLSEELLRDRLGSVVGRKTGDPNGPKVLIAGHLDEIGFMVTGITEKGFLRFQMVGSWLPHNVLSHRVRVRSRKGEYLGLIGSKAPHVMPLEERRRLVELKDMFIDVGASSREEVEEMGIRPGDPIIPESPFFTMKNGELWGGKALDNRAGCALAVELLHALQDTDHPNIVFAGATVQEEVGLRGAETLANLVEPDVAIAVDVALAYDTPGHENHPLQADLGKGPVLFLMDHFLIAHQGLRDFLLETAKDLDIPVQFEVMMGGGTDGGRFHLQGIGCPTIGIGCPTRYIHSHNGIMCRKDFEQTVRLLKELVRRLDRRKLEELLA
ncbi:M42 family metallopeptidase [Staphylospora marina]|uniref:M42 family metallopeptidase n=1 Tax=Staphylospora marina TaxID=2490858 RepID=UPI000F5C0CD4|nr:M42 family metallopeptidase [Staphylospora marina]